MKFLQKSVARGILSNKAFSRINIPGKSESARDLFNFDIGRSGELYRRGGTALLERLDSPVERIIPFETHDRSYLLVFVRASADIALSRDDDKVDYPFIKVLDMTGFSQEVKNYSDLTPEEFSNSEFVQIYRKGNNTIDNIFDSYYRDPEKKIEKGEMASMTYCQIGNVIVFVNETFPPFAIRKEGDTFVYYRNFMDMVLQGDGEESVIDALSVFPYSYYGFGMKILSTDNRGAEGKYFHGEISRSLNFDKSAFSKENILFWQNRLFINSVSKANDSGVTVWGGIIRETEFDGDCLCVFGEYFNRILEDSDILTADSESEQNMYICDWSPRVGWPRSVAEFENRFCYGGNEAYPAKLWFSSQPSIQRVPFGSRIRIEKESEEEGVTLPETRIESPIFKTVYYDQLDLFNKDERALGLVTQHTASAGGYFINDARGLSIYWIVKGEVLFIGTNRGIFISSGTDAGASSPIPFNTGFRQIDYVPVKRCFPIVEGKTLYFVTQDESVRMIMLGNKHGYEAKNIDSFSREIVRDNSSLEYVSKNIIIERLTKMFSPGSSMDITRRTTSGTLAQTLFSGEQTLNLALIANGKYYFEDDSSGRVHRRARYRFYYQKPEMTLSDSQINAINPLRAPPNYNKIFPRIYDTSYDGQAEFRKYFKLYIDKTAENNKLKNYSVNTFLHRVDITPYIYYDGSRFRTLLAQCTINFLQREGTDPDITNVTHDRNPQSSDVADSVSNVRPVNSNIGYFFSGIYQTTGDVIHERTVRKIYKITSFLKGTINNGYVLPDRVNFNSNNADTENNRLCGAVVASGSLQTLKLYFTENTFARGIAHLRVVSGANEKDFVSDNVALPIRRQSSDYGRVRKNVYEATLNLGFNVATGSRLQVMFYKDDPATEGSEPLNTINITLVRDGNNFVMRDSLLNNYSGTFVNRHIHFNIDSFEQDRVRRGGSTVYVFKPSSRSRLYPTAALAGSNSERQLTGYIGALNMANTLGVEMGKYKLNVTGVARTGTVTTTENTRTSVIPPSFSITNVDRQVVQQSYPAFSSDTRLIYDWVRSCLMVFRKSNYIAYFNDKEGGIEGWTRGDMNAEDVCNLPKLKYSLPDKHPAIFISRGQNIYFQTLGQHDPRFSYVEKLPNCLDEHIIFKKSSSISGGDLKSKIKALGYEDDDLISLAVDNAVIRNNVKVGDLSGKIDLKGKSNLIIGKSFLSKLISAPIPIEDRQGGNLITQKHSINGIILYLLVGVIREGEGKRGPAFSINEKPVQILRPQPKSVLYSRPDITTIEAYEYAIQTGKYYNPSFSLSLDNPFAFAVTGWALRFGK